FGFPGAVEKSGGRFHLRDALHGVAPERVEHLGPELETHGAPDLIGVGDGIEARELIARDPRVEQPHDAALQGLVTRDPRAELAAHGLGSRSVSVSAERHRARLVAWKTILAPRARQDVASVL